MPITIETTISATPENHIDMEKVAEVSERVFDLFELAGLNVHEGAIAISIVQGTVFDEHKAVCFTPSVLETLKEVL